MAKIIPFPRKPAPQPATQTTPNFEQILFDLCPDEVRDLPFGHDSSLEPQSPECEPGEHTCDPF